MIAEGEKDTPIPVIVSEASGVVLELGPGLGTQLPRYDLSKITKVYGVEPNKVLHKALMDKIKTSGLSDIYEIVPCGVENPVELERYGIVPNSVDTVLSIQVLCSVPDLEETTRRLYAFMKPGGQFIVYEHVRSTDVVSGIVQSTLLPLSIVQNFFGSDLMIELQICGTSSGPFSLAIVISLELYSHVSNELESGRESSSQCRRQKMHGTYSHGFMAVSGRNPEQRSDLREKAHKIHAPRSKLTQAQKIKDVFLSREKSI